MPTLFQRILGAWEVWGLPCPCATYRRPDGVGRKAGVHISRVGLMAVEQHTVNEDGEMWFMHAAFGGSGSNPQVWAGSLGPCTGLDRENRERV